MSEIENLQDKIDEYIRGTMSAEDKNIFEEELRSNANLRHEVEVQASIAEAVQVVRLRELLQEAEAGLSRDASSQQEKSKPVLNPIRRKVLIWVSAAAACVLLFFIANSLVKTQRIKGLGDQYYAALVEPVSRDGNKIDSLLVSSYQLIGQGNFDLAIEDLQMARQLIETGLSVTGEDEEAEYLKAILNEKRYDADWYEILILMKEGDYNRDVKDLLMTISKSDSPYANDAQNILETMFNI